MMIYVSAKDYVVLIYCLDLLLRFQSIIISLILINVGIILYISIYLNANEKKCQYSVSNTKIEFEEFK